MKTDPTLKQELYYSSIKKKLNRAIVEKTETTFNYQDSISNDETNLYLETP